MILEDWIYVAADRDQLRVIVTRALNFLVPYTVGDFLSIWADVAFSRRTELLGMD
jgi:hypothetical protein